MIGAKRVQKTARRTNKSLAHAGVVKFFPASLAYASPADKIGPREPKYLYGYSRRFQVAAACPPVIPAGSTKVSFL